MEHEYSEEVAKRLIEQATAPLWEGGPSFVELVKRFTGAIVEDASLDSWVPYSSVNVRSIAFMFFRGYTYRLAQELAVHPKSAGVGLLLGSLHTLSFTADQKEITAMAFADIPRLCDDKNEPVENLGASSAEDWLKRGLDQRPDTSRFLRLLLILEEHALPEHLDPGGIATEVQRLFARSRGM